MKVLIVDDEPLARSRLRRLLSAKPDIIVAAECRNGREAIKAVAEHRPDLIFLDVAMPEMDGFDVLRALDPMDLPAVVFVTAYDHYATRAFEVHALDYLLKPFDGDRFEQTLARARAHLERARIPLEREKLLALLAGFQSRAQFPSRIAVRQSEKTIYVETRQIEWIESCGNYVVLHVGRAGHIVRQTMKEIERSIDPQMFRRVHRTVIVNIDHMRELHSRGQGEYEIVLVSGGRVKVSRRYRQNLE